jgi:SAM-dependent methyltransferase
MAFSALNKLCDLRDFSDHARVAAIREVEPEYLGNWPNYPAGREHRRSWEYAQLLLGVDALNAVNRDSLVLGVRTGADKALFALTNRARLVFAADVYAGGPAERMLTEPEALTACPFDRNRLIVQHMQSPDLRYEDETFDLVYSFGVSGGLPTALPLLDSMTRVCRTGGLVMMTVEHAVEGQPPAGGPLTRDEVQRLLASQTSLRLAQPVDWTATKETLRNVRHLDQVIADLGRGHTDYPHIVLEQHGCRFTSLSLFLSKGRANA